MIPATLRLVIGFPANEKNNSPDTKINSLNCGFEREHETLISFLLGDNRIVIIDFHSGSSYTAIQLPIDLSFNFSAMEQHRCRKNVVFVWYSQRQQVVLIGVLSSLLAGCANLSNTTQVAVRRSLFPGTRKTPNALWNDKKIPFSTLPRWHFEKWHPLQSAHNGNY